MENELDNRTKKWLRAYARQRREQAGREMELPEATRRMLLDEAKRVWGEAAELEPETAPTESPWLRWAWFGAAAAVVMVLAVISRNSSQDNPAGRPMEIAKNNPGTSGGNVVDQNPASTPPRR